MNVDALHPTELQRTFEDMAKACGINAGMLAVSYAHSRYINTFVHFAWLGYVAENAKMADALGVR